MHIQTITFLSGPGGDAEVEIVDGDVRCLAFSSPFNGKVGQQLTEPLHVFGLREAKITEREDLGFWKSSPSRLDQRVVAEVSDLSESLLKVGGVALKVDDHLPGGLSNGDRIAFECDRIDLW